MNWVFGKQIIKYILSFFIHTVKRFFLSFPQFNLELEYLLAVEFREITEITFFK